MWNLRLFSCTDEYNLTGMLINPKVIAPDHNDLAIGKILGDVSHPSYPNPPSAVPDRRRDAAGCRFSVLKGIARESELGFG
jgi:hypothetical protein